MSKHRTRTTGWERLLSGVLCLALMLGLLPAAGIVQFAKAAEAEHWATPYAEQLLEWGVMKSASDLRLDDEATRAEFVAMCNRAFGYKKLGGIPFTDVPSSEWYAQDIDIAYNAGYFKGTSDTTAEPEEYLTREQAAVLIARNLMLQETVGESLGFTDSRELSEWSRGLIAAAAAEGMISGYEDGSYRPFNNITRGEVAAMLVRAIGNPVSAEGSYELDDVYGNVTISSSNVTLRDTVILGNLYITGGVDLGNVLLENVTVLGRIVISGGGESNAAQSSVILRNVSARDELVVDSMINQFVTVSAYGLTDIPRTSVRSDAYLEDLCTGGYGLKYIELPENEYGTELQLAGNIKEVVNKTPGSFLKLVKGTAEKITIDEYATNSQLLVDINTRVDELNLDVATLVTGKGDIIQLNIWADGCEVDILPEHVDIRPGITATVDGKLIGSADASELSSEPRLMPGYPKADSLQPTQANGLFSGNKPGTIYWAVSEVGDGSVSPEDLLNNPVYGGNIYKDNASSINAANARGIYVELLKDLEPDGSYYISAILVDERNVRSPLKVVSFTTPDNTTPEIVKDYPRMTLVTCETAQVTVMANKNCQLYWALLPAGATPPTAQNFKSGSFGGSYGSGSQSVAKNVPASITVNSTRLQENTYYELYLWLNDFDGAMSSVVYHVTHESAAGTSYSFRTPDETAPVITKLMQSEYGANDAQVQFAVGEAPSTLYWAVVKESNESFIPTGSNMESLEVQRKVKTSTPPVVIASGSKPVTDDSDYYIDVTGLDYGKNETHSFKFYCVAEDAAGNFSEVRLLVIRTLDTDPPHVWLEFSDAKNGNPRTGSDISIVFDEEVQGGTNAENTFLELYERVVTYQKLGASYASDLTAAKNALAAELNTHFQLWPGSMDKQLTARGDEQKDGNWVIDWHQATVTKEAGKLIITIPNSALNLDSGASYQFRLYSVFDLAQSPNAIAVDEKDGVTCVRTGGKASTSNSSNGSRNLPKLAFTTVYAQVELYDRRGVDRIESDKEKIDNIRLDMAFDVVPKSTGKVPDTEYWDMIIWSNTTVRFDLYRKILNADGTEVTEKDENGKTVLVEDWELIASGTPDASSGNLGFTITPGENSNTKAISLNARKLPGIEKYETVKDGLDEKYIYRYGIHLTEVQGISEGDGLEKTDKDGKPIVPAKENPIAWGVEDLVFSISLVAGKRSNVQLSGDIDARYKTLTGSGDLSVIGDVDGDGVESVLQCHCGFDDIKVPSFAGDFPMVSASSNVITIDIALDRKGTVFYVIAPAYGTGSIPTEIDKDRPITNADGTNTPNDGSKNGADDATGGSLTYIPKDGKDRNDHPEIIWFVPDPKNTASKAEKYGSPLAGAIVDGTYSGRITGSIKYDGETVTIREGGLESNTWYYVYMVLQGGGDYDEIVQIYRVQTTPATPPVITISASGLTASMETYDGSKISSSATRPRVDSELTYALVSWSNLPSFFRTQFTWDPDGIKDSGDEGSGTLIDMLIKRDGTTNNSPTLFDEYAKYAKDGSGKTAESYKSELMTFIRNGGTYTGEERPLEFGNRNYSAVGDPVAPTFTNVPEDNTEVEYGVLVYARTVGAGDGVEHYAFAAAQGMYLPDPVPPVFVPQTTPSKRGVSYVTVSNLKAYSNAGNQYGDLVWRSQVDKDPAAAYGMTFSGTMTITFTKPLYQYITIEIDDTDGNKTSSTVRRPVLAGAAGSDGKYTNNASGVHFLEAISKPSRAATKVDGKEVPHSAVKFTVTGGTSAGAQSVFNITFDGLTMGDTLTILGGGRITNSSPTGKVSNYRLTLVFDPTLTNEAFLEEGEYMADAMKKMIAGGFRATWAETP